ncbi:hypothetical protein ACP3V5_03630 [Vibrio maritimus]
MVLVQLDRSAADFFETKDSFIDLGMESNEQDNVVILGELIGVEGKYVA